MPTSQAVHDACIAAIHTSRRGDSRQGLELARQAYRQARKENNPASELTALNTVAFCQSAHADYIGAIATAIDAYELARRLDDRAGMTGALTAMAGAAGFILETDDISLRLLQRCLDNALALDAVTLEVRIRNLRGVLFGNQKRFDEAEREFELALKKSDQTGDLMPTWLLMANSADLAIRRAEFADGSERETWRRIGEQRTSATLELGRSIGQIEAQARMHANLGEIRGQQGRYGEAADAYERAIAALQPLQQHVRRIHMLLGLAGVQLAGGLTAEAIPVLLRAYTEAQTTRPTRLLGRACQLLAAAYRQLQQGADAQQWQSRAETEDGDYARECTNVRRQLQIFMGDLAAGAAPD